MAATARSILPPRFVRRTGLQPHETNTNFTMLDNEVAAAITSPEADAVTPLMSKIYLRLKTAPRDFFESSGVLRFTGEDREGKRVTAWEQLRGHLRVSSETAHKALTWMHNEGVIGYSAFKNGVGIKIFLNRAASSIGMRRAAAGEKILHFSPASLGDLPASPGETPYKVETIERELDQNFKSPAPKNCAGVWTSDETSRTLNPANSPAPVAATRDDSIRHPTRPAAAAVSTVARVEEIVAFLRRELESSVKTAAAEAAAREHERTRQWLDRHGIPKATRVAQKEAYDVLRSHGVIDTARERARAALEVGSPPVYSCPHGDSRSPTARPLTPGELAEVASTCVALYEAQGKAIDETLREIGAEAGGWVLPEDAPLVREAAQVLLDG